jgi:hypothetical protein
MHLARPHLFWCLPLLLSIGIFSCILNAEVEEPEVDELVKKHVVWVEPLDGIKLKPDGVRLLTPYRERRGDWGLTFGFAYSSYEPVNYQTAFGAFAYNTVYASPSTPMLEAQFSFKYNLSFGSVGIDVAAGDMDNMHTDVDFVGSHLNVAMGRVGAVYYMDTLNDNPYYVPYASLGTYIVYYSEKLSGNSVSGNTSPGLYINAGCAFPVDWMDPISARAAYEEGGLQRTYIFAEVRKYFQSFNSSDPDFSNNINWGAGLRMEF